MFERNERPEEGRDQQLVSSLPDTYPLSFRSIARLGALAFVIVLGAILLIRILV